MEGPVRPRSRTFPQSDVKLCCDALGVDDSGVLAMPVANCRRAGYGARVVLRAMRAAGSAAALRATSGYRARVILRAMRVSS